MRRQVWMAILSLLLLCTGCAELETGDVGEGDNDAAATEEAPDLPEQTSPPAIDMSGSGKHASQKFSVIGGLTVFRMTHQGSSNFAVQLLDGSSGEQVELLANEIGNYEGSKVVGVESGEYAFDIEADGPWTIRIDQPRVDTGTVTSPVTGNGPTAVGPVTFDGGLTTFQLKHSGESNFAVVLLDNEGNQVELLANEIGNFEGSKNTGVEAGIYWLDVAADGPWTISF